MSRVYRLLGGLLLLASAHRCQRSGQDAHANSVFRVLTFARHRSTRTLSTARGARRRMPCSCPSWRSSVTIGPPSQGASQAAQTSSA